MLDLVPKPSIDVFRMVMIMLPSIILTYHFVHREHAVIRWVGALFAHIWQFQWRLILFTIGIHFHWWHFQADGALLFGVPTDIILASGLLLGALPRIIAPQISVFYLLILDAMLTVFVLPIYYPPSSLPLLLLISAIVILPSHGLAKWTEQDQRLYLRSILQNMGWAILLLWLFPSVVFNLTNDSWTPFLERSLWLNALLLLPMQIPGMLIFSALYEFAKEGRGTGFPYDAPKYLVTSGIYKYLSNPMQTGIVLMMLLWGAILESGLIMLSSPVALVLFLVFKHVCNGSCNIGSGNPDWERYQSATPKWMPFRF